MSTFEHIIVDSKGAVGIITLNRPKMLNALSFGVFQGNRRRGRRSRGRRQDRLHPAGRRRKGFRGGRRHQGNAAENLHRHVFQRFHRHRRRPRRQVPQADHCRGQRLCARRRLRTRHDVRHHHRRRHRQIRPAGNHPRHHPRYRRHPAADARGRQIQGDGPVPHRADDGCRRSGTLGAREPRRAMPTN